jgi:nitroimidazol reductase NimA-like FMN-containing flavoprotein (pyridoxamine 5'-phosphate oxidase superfamily)
MNEPAEMTYEKCLELLSGGVVGRAAVCTPSGPRIMPVNYSVVDESVIFRTTPYSILGTYAWNSQLAFEVDQIDHERQQGWSVVATGRGASVDDPEELAAIRSFWNPRPWAGGQRLLYVRLRWQELTGRRIGADWTRETEMPFRRTL